MIRTDEDEIRVVITGGRDWRDMLIIHNWIESMIRFGQEMSLPVMFGVGDCPTGADSIAWAYLEENGYAFRRFEADWDRHGKDAGKIRNKAMVKAIRPTHTLAFITPDSRGTHHCANYAQPTSRVYRINTEGKVLITPAGEPVPSAFLPKRA